MNASPEPLLRWLAAFPWLALILIAAPLLLAAWRTRTYPTARWAWLVGLSLLCSLLVIRSPDWLLWLALVDATAALLAALDYLALPTSRGVDAQRSIVHTASINAPIRYELTLRNRSRHTLRGAVRDDLPDRFRCDPEEHPLDLPPLAQVTLRQKMTPTRRGAFELQRVYLEARSRLGLWRRHLVLPVESRLNVFPDMKQLGDYALLARTNRLSLIGVRRTRRIGQDSDFERLRDYSRDDNYRHIDWRTTARRNKLTVRQYQSDQSQRVIFMLDCGRMMTNERGGLSLLDHALNACLMLAYVALARGDAVGMLCFSDRVQAYIPPRGGRDQMNRLLQASFDQFPRLVESRYDQAFLYLRGACRRRSLVILATNVIDEVNAGQVVDYLGHLVGHHLPLGVLLRDRQMFDAADHPGGLPHELAAAGGVPSRRALYRAAAAAEILCWRDQVIRDLRHRGALVLDTYPDELTAPLVNQYLQIKAQHLL